MQMLFIFYVNIDKCLCLIRHDSDYQESVSSVL